MSCFFSSLTCTFYRFRWVYCQLDHLGKCLPGRIQHALKELPDTLDVTYERTLREINDANWEFARRLFQCVAVAARPLRVEELAEFLAFDFSAGPIPKFREEWRLEDPLQAVMSTCSTLLALVKVKTSQVIQFSHYSVKEFMTSTRFAEKRDTTSCRYHVSMTPAHTVVAQACLGILLHFRDDITKDSLTEFPLAVYAAEHWFEHARFEGVSQYVEDGMKQLFDASRPHFSIWLWIYDPIWRRGGRADRPLLPRGTPLYHAAFCGLTATVKFLTVRHSKHLHSRAIYDGSTPLHVASSQGHLAVARVLVEHGANVTARDDGGATPLHQASRYGGMDLVRFLIKHGANVTTRNKYGGTPLHWASARGHLDVVRFLIEHGADAMARSTHGRTPLHGVSENGNLDLVQFLVEHGADATARENHGETPLHLASYKGYLDLAQFLVEHGADARARRNNGETPLHSVSKSSRENVDLGRFLVEHGATTAQDNYGNTPLHRASSNGYLDLARFLVEHGDDAAARNNYGDTPLHKASYRGNLDLARFLIEHGADATAQNNYRRTPLHRASYGGHLGVPRLLIEHGADAMARKRDPLHQASYQGDLDTAPHRARCRHDSPEREWGDSAAQGVATCLL